MAARTGTQYVTFALREIRVLDPTAAASGERLNDGMGAACDLLDTWRTMKLTMRGTTISPYTLVSGKQTYTIGPNGDFNQVYPASIDNWSIVPDVTAAYPSEIPKGRPLTADEWQQIGVKTNPGQPYALYFDRSYVAGLGNVLVYPIPNAANIGVRLYEHNAVITALVAGTSYDLAPGFQRAFQLNLALELADRYGTGATVSPGLAARANAALSAFLKSNIVPKESQIRREFAIGQDVGRRTFQIYNGSSR
jgi:hypothetical protein